MFVIPAGKQGGSESRVFLALINPCIKAFSPAIGTAQKQGACAGVLGVAHDFKDFGVCCIVLRHAKGG